jgi:hypothetical protein
MPTDLARLAREVRHAREGPEVTAPTTAAPDSSPANGGTDAGGAGPEEGQAPDTTTGNDTGEQHQQPPKPRERTERVRSASRDDDAVRDSDDDDGGDGDAGQGKGGKKDWRIDDLPPGAQDLIKNLRKEAGTRRTEAAEQKKAAETATQQAKAVDEKFASAVEAFTKALGLTPDADEPERSPEELLGDITSKYQQKTVELAVYKGAAAAGGDPDALLDSRGFLTKAFALDPAGEGFDTAIAEAIRDAVDSNPKLRAAEPERPAVPSGGDFGGGPADRNDPDEWSVDDFRRERNKARGSSY